MRIMVVSVAPWATSGYSTQAKRLALSLKDDGHEVAFFATFGLTGGMIWWNDIPVFPAAEHGHGSDIILAHVDEWKPDIVISLLDVWPMDNYGGRYFRWIPWTPIDHDPVPTSVASRLQSAWKVASMSHYGEEELNKMGIGNTYLPLGISKEFYIDPQSGKDWRADHNIPDDTFVYGMVGINRYWPPRKGFDRALEAFAEIHREHPDTILYLHTTPLGTFHRELDLLKIADFFGVPRTALRFSDSYPLFMGYSEAGMRALYNSFDCLLFPTQAEGFGLPVVEAQACGIPVIATDCTTMPELTVEGLCELVPWNDRYLSLGYSWQYEVSVPDLVNSMEFMYDQLMEGRHEGLPSNAIDGRTYKNSLELIAGNYKWENVYREYWRPFLRTIEEEIGCPPSKLFPDHIRILDDIGTGDTSAKVFRGLWNGQSAIIKLDRGAYYGKLEDEATILQQLDHQGIPRVLEVGRTAFGRPYMVLEDMGFPVDIESLSPEERMDINTQITTVALYLHEQGFVHRDIKLENVVYDSSTKVAALVDFGFVMPHITPEPCPDLHGRGPDELQDVTNGLVGTGLPVLLLELSEGVDKQIAMSMATGGVYSYTKDDGISLPSERDSEQRWALMYDAESDPDWLDGLEVLDIGCNIGFYVRRALDDGASYAYGIDKDSRIISVADTLTHDLRAEFRVFDVDKDDPKSLGKVDVVFALSVIMHLQSPGCLWKLFDIVEATTVYLEVPRVDEYPHITGTVEEWRALADGYGWAAKLLGLTDRDRPLFKLTR